MRAERLATPLADEGSRVHHYGDRDRGGEMRVGSSFARLNALHVEDRNAHRCATPFTHTGGDDDLRERL